MTFPEKPPLLTYVHSLRSRYSETDKMGYVYYGHFLQYFEVTRTEFVRELGIPYREMEDEGIMLPVVRTDVEYKCPVQYDQLMHIHMYIYDIPTVRLKTFYEVVIPQKDIISTLGRVDLCFIDARTRRPVRAPLKFIESLKTFSIHDE